MSEVLVVDDDADITLLVCELLRYAGFDARSMPSGLDALRWLDETEQLPVAVLLDVQMPELDGWDTLRSIRSDDRTSTLPVVLCTVKASPADQELGRRLGCDAYVRKPFDIDELIAAVHRAMDGRRREGPH